jgi:uncharacterized 2Fe-2S/4Fe-4S cluster protein (DUF4445 family)
MPRDMLGFPSAPSAADEVPAASVWSEPPVQAELESLPESALQKGFRLACFHLVTSDLVVEILPIVSRGKEDASPLERTFELCPPVQRYQVQLSAATLEDSTDDVQRLTTALEEAGAGPIEEVDYALALRLPRILRESQWNVAASVRQGELVNVVAGGIGVSEPRETGSRALGLAVDLGTTNIASYLYDLTDGALLGIYGIANPLATFGADIISRLSHSDRAPENGAQLQRILVTSLSLLAEQVVHNHGGTVEDVEEMVVVGNTGMHHLFLNLTAGQLIRAPYVPVMRRQTSIKARDIGLAISPGGYVHMPPLVGGFIGSDLLSVALSTRIDRKPGVRLAIDIGTNTELLLSLDGELSACSTASGPALEGAALEFGCVAMPGAVDKVWTDGPEDPFRFTTIKKKPAIGICGSGIIDALATMLQSEIMNASGRIQASHRLVTRQANGNHRMTLVPAALTDLSTDLTISQTDVRAIQMAKGAIRAGAETILSRHGLKTTDIDEILVAGAFGSHINLQSALEIGLFPPVGVERIRQIGNAAGTGASLMLLSTSERKAAGDLASRIEHVELATDPGFVRLFALSQRFTEME